MRGHHSCFHPNRLKDFDNVPVAGEHQNLMPSLCKGIERFGCVSSAITVKIHKHIIQHQRQRHSAPRVDSRQRKSQGDEHRFACTPTQAINLNRSTGMVINMQLVCSETCPNTLVFSIGKLLKKTRCLA